LAIIIGLLGFGLAATLLLDAISADINWTGRFYRPAGPHGGWVFLHANPWAFLYDYGEIPGLALAVLAAGLYTATFFGKARSDYRRACLVIVLTVVLGPGILVNGILKSGWGRPRPVEVTLFGGAHEYQKAWEMGVPGRGKSFTCGHCSMGFAIASAAAFYPFHPVLSIAALIGGVAYGILLGAARMAQGGHFPTDVLWSGVIVLVVLAALYYLVFRVPEHATREDR